MVRPLHDFVALKFVEFRDTDKILEDKYLERLDRIFSLKAARPRNVTNLCNWLEYTGCVARDETEFLTAEKDLISPIRAEDSALTPFEELIEDVVINIRPLRRFVSLCPSCCCLCLTNLLPFSSVTAMYLETLMFAYCPPQWSGPLHVLLLQAWLWRCSWFPSLLLML